MSSALMPASLLALVLVSRVQEPRPEGLPALDPAITRAELEHHVRFLASDELGGRAPFSSGAERSAHYLAQALAAAGVEPAGEGGTFLQDTGLERHVYPSPPRLLFFEESGAMVEAKYGVDFNVTARGTMRSTEKLPLRFFYDYNHARMPLEGNPAEAIYFSANKDDKHRILSAKGITTLADWGLELSVLLGPDGLEPGRAQATFPARLVCVREPDGCEEVELRGPLRAGFDRRKYSHVQLLVEQVVEPLVEQNVVGRVRGKGTSARPELADEAVLLFANYDHDGTLPPRRATEGADRLFNGADDNASGCAVLLELAQAVAAGPAPARTLVFAFLASEEVDGAGSRGYLAAPAEPLAKTVVALGLQRLGHPDALAGGPGKPWLTGFPRSNLGLAWQELGLSVGPDPRPEKMYFQRFHAHRLVQAGLVAQTLSSTGDEPESGGPDDEPDTLDYAHMEAAARVVLQAVQTLADGTLQPAWRETEPSAKKPEDGVGIERPRLREKPKKK